MSIQTNGIDRVSVADLKRVLLTIHQGGLLFPVSRSGLIAAAFGHIEEHLDVIVGLERRSAQAVIAAVLKERAAAGAKARLVFSGPEVMGGACDDASAIAQELISSATRSVLVCGLPGTPTRIPLSTLRAAMLGRGIEAKVVLATAPTGLDAQGFLAAAGWSETDPRPRLYVPAPGVLVRGFTLVIDAERMFTTSQPVAVGSGDQTPIDAGVVVDHPATARLLIAQWERLILAGSLERID